MYAVEYALVICNLISCIPTIPSVLFSVDSDRADQVLNNFMEQMPSAQDQPLLKLFMKFQFMSLFALYMLGVIAGFYCATPGIAYMFATGNIIRVAYILLQQMDAQKKAMMGFKQSTINTILIVQGVLAVVIVGCTYVSSNNAEYQAYQAEMAAAALTKWDTQGFYIKFLLGVHGFFTLVQIPGVISPAMAIKNYITNEAKLPTDKQGSLVLEFTMGFQQLAILMLQVFGGVMLWYSPTIDPVALFWIVFGGIYFVINIFCFNILNADKYGFDRVPMLVFLVINVWVAGASFQAYFE